jgi:uncharacterized membrane protein
VSTRSQPDGAPALARFAVVLAALTVLAQIAYPLTSGHLRTRFTIAAVVLFFATSVTHAAVWRGARWAAALAVTSCAIGLAAEAVGVHTGVPFGAYRYTGTLGWSLLGVPVVIPMAWTMMAYPALLVGRIVAAGRPNPAVVSIAVGAAALVTWDLFLDPQMVDAGHWTWRSSSWPVLLGIPLSNYAGWAVVAVVLLAVLSLLPHRPADDRVPFALFLWTYASEVMGHAVFFGRPGVALVGGVAMGAVVMFFLLSLPSRPWVAS